MGSLDNLKKEAKRWLKALRANDAEARARLTRAWPEAPAEPCLRDVQHALAREHGHENWKAFATLVDTRTPDAAPREPLDDRIVASFLQMACWDHHDARQGRSPDVRSRRTAAARAVSGAGAHSLYTAIVCGNLAEVQRIVNERPAAAREPGGSRGWTPILYSTYTRFTQGGDRERRRDRAAAARPRREPERLLHGRRLRVLRASSARPAKGSRTRRDSPTRRTSTACCWIAARDRTTSRCSTTRTSRATCCGGSSRPTSDRSRSGARPTGTIPTG